MLGIKEGNDNSDIGLVVLTRYDACIRIAPNIAQDRIEDSEIST